MIGLVYSFLPFMVLPIYASIERFDWRLADAALDLGANRTRLYRTVILPIIRPGLIAGSILVFIPCLGAYITPQLLGGGRQMLLGNFIALQFGASRTWSFGAATAVLLLVCVLLVLLMTALSRSKQVSLRQV